MRNQTPRLRQAQHLIADVVRDTPPPRRVVWAGHLPRFLYLLFAIAIALAVIPSYADYTLGRQLYASGVVTSAAVIAKHLSGTRTTSYIVDLFYLDGLQSYDVTATVSHAEYDACTQGESTTITYLPSDHGRICIGRESAKRVHASHDRVESTIAIGFVIWIVVLSFSEGMLWRQFRLLGSGVFTQATIESVDESGRKGNEIHRIRYRFVVDDRSIDGAVTRPGAAVSSPPVGSPIAIVYNPGNPQQNKPIADITYVRLT